MAKTQKRQVSFTTPDSSAIKRPANSSIRPSSEFNPDYTYVKKDLKNLAYQMVAFLGILFILTFFLR
jgi:hypothetical protein